MTAYTRNFELDLTDMDVIETALHEQVRELSQKQLASANGEAAEAVEKLREVKGLLGRLHNQKTFYRPKTGVYVGG